MTCGSTLARSKPISHFGQLLKISLMACKTLKEGMPVTRRKKKAKTRVAPKMQQQRQGHDVKVVEIEAIIVDKVCLICRWREWIQYLAAANNEKIPRRVHWQKS